MLNMKNIPDKEFDEIFKQAAERVDIQYNPTAWDRFEKKIDRSAVSKNGGWKIISSFVVLFLSGVIIGWNSLPNKQETEDSLVASIEQPRYLNGATEVESQFNEEIKSLVSARKQHEVLKDLTAKDEVLEARIDQKIKRFEDHRQIKAGASFNFNVKQKASVLFQQDELSTTIYKEGTLSSIMDEDVQKNIFSLSPKKPWLENEHSPNTIIERAQVIKSQKTLFKPYFSVALIASPDFSGLGFSTLSKSGSNMGVTLEYHFSPRFSFTTGMVRSRKIYSVTEGFEPYEGYWDYKHKPDLIDGGCIVLDIPININYNFPFGEKSNAFVSTGLSSYIMTRENYNYIYSNYQNDYEIKNKNNHILGIYNLSIGYERFIGSKWSLGIEPFAKIPITQIGYGNLKLMSTGAFFSLNYHFNKKRP